MKKNVPDMPIAVAWYRPEQWALLRACSIDAGDLEDTFSEWVEHADRLYKEYEESGMNMHKILIDIDALVAWCRSRNIPVNGEARSQYAAVLMKEIDS